MFLSNFFWSRIVKRHAFRGVLYGWTLLGASLPLLALLLAHLAPAPVFLVLFFLNGAAMSARKIAQEGALIEISENDNRVLYSGINGAFNLTIALFPLISGFAITWLGYVPVFILGSLSMLSASFFVRRLHCESGSHA
jgi:predicted MFS family arabinose efflux permease